MKDGRGKMDEGEEKGGKYMSITTICCNTN